MAASTFAISPITALADSLLIPNYSINQWYQRFDASMGWYNAKAFCEKRGGYLVTKTTQSENDFISTNLATTANPGGIWLGATNDKTGSSYQWITGETWSYANWSPGQPDNWSGAMPGGGKHYLMLVLGSGGKWNDIGSYNQGAVWGSGYYTMSTICEWGGSGSWNF